MKKFGNFDAKTSDDVMRKNFDFADSFSMKVLKFVIKLGRLDKICRIVRKRDQELVVSGW